MNKLVRKYVKYSFCDFSTTNENLKFLRVEKNENEIGFKFGVNKN